MVDSDVDKVPTKLTLTDKIYLTFMVIISVIMGIIIVVLFFVALWALAHTLEAIKISGDILLNYLKGFM